jgi:Flp pilus assembly pilin Flp
MTTARRRQFRGATGDEGASAVEYALIVVSIAAVIVLIVVALGLMVNKSIGDSCTHIKSTLGNPADTCGP